MSNEKFIKTTYTHTTIYEVEITGADLEKILRDLAGAPDNADVDYDCSYDHVNHVTVTWSETTKVNATE